MKKITQNAMNAWNNNKPFFKDNTLIILTNDAKYLYLFGNLIAVAPLDHNVVYFTMAGYPTVTTRERLKIVVGIRQHKGDQYFKNEKISCDLWYLWKPDLNELEQVDHRLINKLF